MPRRRRSAFGRLYRRKAPDGTYLPGYYARFRAGSREVTRWAGPDKKTANEFLSEMHRRIAREHLLGERSVPDVTFAEVERAILSHFKARHASSTYQSDVGRLAVIREYFGSKPLHAISVGDVQEFVTHLRARRGVAAATSNRYLSCLSLAMSFAVDKGWATDNPARAVRRSPEDVRPVPFVSVEEVKLLCAHAACPRFSAFIRVLADTGLRSGEARRLEWRDVSLSRGALTVRRSKNHRPREVHLTDAVADVFAQLNAERAACPLRGPDFVWPELAAIGKSAVSARFRRLAARAGLPLRAHDLRHGFCSRLAQAGVPLPTVGLLAGHQSVATTQRYASHVPDGATAQAIEQLQRVERGPFRSAKGDIKGDAGRDGAVSARGKAG